MEKIINISEAAQFLGVSKPTLRRWEINSKLKSLRTLGNHRRYPLKWLENIRDGKIFNYDIDGNQETKNEERKSAIYARVSTYEQKKNGNLERQVARIKEYAEKKKEKIEIIIGENGSGLNTERKGLDRLLKMVEQKKISKIYLEYPDRLTRFGFKYLFRYCQSYGTQIECISNNIEKSPEEELTNDIMALLVCFSGRLYSKRRGGRANLTESEKIHQFITEYIDSEIEKTIN